MPCNYQPSTITATIKDVKPEDVTSVLDEMKLTYTEGRMLITITNGQTWPNDNRNLGEIRITITDEGELNVEALETDEWVVPILEARLMAKKLADETKAKGGYVKGMRVLPNGTVIMMVGASRGDGQIVTITITGKQAQFRVTGTDLDVCNPLQHHLQHAIGAEHDHTHKHAVLARVQQKWGKSNVALVKSFK